MLKYILLLQFLFISLLSITNNTDTIYISKYPFKGTIYSYLINKNNNIEYKNIERNYSLFYYPNSWGSFGIGGSYKWIDLSLGISSYGKKDEAIYGKTNRIDIQSHLYPKNYIIDLFFQYYQSFYSNSYYLTNESKKIYLRPDISMAQIGASLLRVLKSDKFSVKSAFSASEIQNRSCGTWTIGGKFNTFAISSDSSITSTLLDTIFKQDFRLKSFNTISIGCHGGYMYNYKVNDWLFNLSIIAGIALQLQRKELISKPNIFYPHSTAGAIVNARLAATYTKNRFYLIIAGISDNCQYPLNNYIKLIHIFGRVDIICGYRIFSTNKSNLQALNL